ncbi:MAG: endo-1,4-beta-xylanase [Planctomycetota bacterium]|nr:endo-1,4-beta-xylanase [Planctomycetota bacterium]
MLRFVVPDPGGAVSKAFAERHAHLFAADDLPLQATITIEPASAWPGMCVIRAERSGNESAGLCLQIPVPAPEGSGSLGLLTLQTCLLPDRKATDQPYVLWLELARHRLMLVFNKLEEWGLFELAGDDPVLAEFEKARQEFTAALVACGRAEHAGDSAGADAARIASDLIASSDRAARSLALAIDAGERLALIDADRQIKGRISGELYARAVKRFTTLTGEAPGAGGAVNVPGQGGVVHPATAAIGCVATPAAFNEVVQKVASACGDFVSIPTRWSAMEPSEGKYNWGPTDRWIEWAVRVAKMPVVAGPLIDLRATTVPESVLIWENDYETLRDLVVEHVQAVVTRYRRTVTRWTVASGLHASAHFRLTYEQIIDLTRIAILLVRKLHPTAKIQVEISEPWGEYHARQRKSLPALLYTDALAQGLGANLAVDAIGLRVQMGQAASGRSARDLLAFSALLDRYAAFEKPLALTMLGCPSIDSPPTPAPSVPAPAPINDDDDDDLPLMPAPSAEPAIARTPGTWRSAWSDEQQAEWLAPFLCVALSKPSVHSVCWQELADVPASPGSAPDMPGGGLVSAGGQLKPAARRMAEIRKALRENRSPIAALNLLRRGV